MAGPHSRLAPTSRASLAVRTVLGFAALAIAVAAAVFGPASTFEYWQGWLYLLAFFGSAAGITLYLWQADPSLLERRVSGGPLAEQQANQRVIQSLASLAFISLLVLPSLDHRFGWSNVQAVVTLAADAVVVLAFGIVFLVFRVNTFTAATVGVATGQTVISQGPYRVVRHPMYAGALLMLLATPIALGSLVGPDRVCTDAGVDHLAIASGGGIVGRSTVWLRGLSRAGALPPLAAGLVSAGSSVPRMVSPPITRRRTRPANSADN